MTLCVGHLLSKSAIAISPAPVCYAAMGEPIWSERRYALRVPVRGAVVLYGETGSLRGTVENLSHGGALFSALSHPDDDAFDGGGDPLALELRLAEGGGWVSGRTVRIERSSRRCRVAVAFDRIDPAMHHAIEASILAARSAARRRPILVIDDHTERRDSLILRLVHRGMTPLAPNTPLEAIDLLTRSHLHVDVCLLAPGFGVPRTDLAAILTDSFPWVTTTEISDDLDATAGRAVEAWATTPVARIATAIG